MLTSFRAYLYEIFTIIQFTETDHHRIIWLLLHGVT